jgi:malonyl-CoA O-methyltransferase
MSAEEPRGPNPSALDPRAVRRHFARAASTYDSAAVLQREVGARMMERLELVRLTPAAILDAGCGTGEALPELASRYPRARRVALDVALPMLSVARERSLSRRSLIERLLRPIGGAGHDAPWFVCADAGALPFAAGAFGLVWSNLTLQWVSDLGRAIAEMHRVLDVGGLATFDIRARHAQGAAGGVPGRRCAAATVGRFVDMHDVGDMMVGAGFADPVMQMEMMTVTYPDARSLLRDLHAIGATNATAGRRRTLTGRRRFERALAALERMPGRTADGQLPASYEVIYGHAWKSAPRRTAEGHAIVSFEREPRTRR